AVARALRVTPIPSEPLVGRSSAERREGPTRRKTPEGTRALPTPRHTPPTIEGRRLPELAMAAGFGSAADELVLRSDPDSLATLGADENSPLLADILRWQGSVLRDRGETSVAEKLYERSLEVARRLEY